MDATLLLASSLVAVFFSSLMFVNAIEYAGSRLNWSHSFTGAIVAPLFTSIPELALFIIAVFIHGGTSGHLIGLGMIFGEPFMTSSLSYFLVFCSILAAFTLSGRKTHSIDVDRSLSIPFVFVLLLFPFALLPGIIHSVYLQYLMGFIFLFFYLMYVRTMAGRRSAAMEEGAEIPYFMHLRNHWGLAALQLLVSALLLYYGANLMVQAITLISDIHRVSPLVVAILVIPVATAIPETLSAMIWAYRGRNSLAIGSIIGEKVLYATFYPGMAMFFIPWELDAQVYLSVLATTIVSLVFFLFSRRGKMPFYAMAIGLPFFIAYIVSVITIF